MISILKRPTVKKTLLVLLSGALLSLAYGVPTLWFLVFVALIPLLHVLKNARSKKELFFWPFFTGILYYGSVFLFYFDAHPIVWLREDAGASLALILFAWVVCVGLFSFFMGVWGVLSTLNFKTLASVGVVASLWVVMEWIQPVGLSLVSWNTSALVGSHLTFGFVGYALAEYPLFLSLASLGGVYVLSFVVVFFNGLLFRLTLKENRNKQRFSEFAFLSVLLFLVSVTVFTINKGALRESEVIRVASLYTTFETFFISTPENEVLRNIQVGSLFDTILYDEKHPDVIILPENTRHLVSLSSAERSELVSRLSSVKKVAIIDSYRYYDAEKEGHTAVLEFETGISDKQPYAKQLLVPTAEYMPLALRMVGNISLVEGWDNFFETRLALEKGSDTVLGVHGNVRVGALFCAEALAPTLYRESVQLGANLLTNSASHALIHDSESLYHQILKFSKTRAAENNRFFIQSGNSVPSFVINNHGQLLGETARDKNAILYADVSLISNATLASKTGEWWIMLFFLISLVSLVTKRMREGGE